MPKLLCSNFFGSFRNSLGIFFQHFSSKIFRNKSTCTKILNMFLCPNFIIHQNNQLEKKISVRESRIQNSNYTSVKIGVKFEKFVRNWGGETFFNTERLGLILTFRKWVLPNDTGNWKLCWLVKYTLKTYI